MAESHKLFIGPVVDCGQGPTTRANKLLVAGIAM